MSQVQAIPHPPRYPLIGNLPQVMGSTIITELIELAKQYGPIYELVIPGSRFYVVSSAELAAEVCDESRFHKVVGGALFQIRRFAGDGLFTAHGDEANWQKAHNILLPGFGMKQMRDYLPRMIEVIRQMLFKWEKMGDRNIEVVDDFTRMTLDTIALCGFDYRFDSFKSEELHPFLHAMVRSLQNSLDRIKKTRIQLALDYKADKQFKADRDLMYRVVDELIQERQRNKANYAGKTDFLSLMLEGVDKKTGEKLDVENIRYQLLTFLIAGHETTSGWLSFATYHIVKNPKVMQKAIEEVDRVLGKDPSYEPTFKDVGELKYIQQILRETLRVCPPAPAFSRAPLEDTIIGGRYQIRKGERVLLLTPALHRDPTAWGEGADTFDPDRFGADKTQSIPEFAYRPFGTGARMCIGQHFALVEATLAIALMLKHLTFEADPQYNLQIKETLTLKPDGFTLKAKVRLPLEDRRKLDVLQPTTLQTPTQMPVQTAPKHGNALAIFYGSNMGSCEEFARKLEQQAQRLGFITHVATLDEAVGHLPNSGLVFIVTATYNGHPPDNALDFAKWIRDPAFRADGLQYAVFGGGNTNWKTFQAFPREVDTRLEAAGAKRIVPRGETDAATDYEGGWETWVKQSFWPKSLEHLGLKLDIDTYLSQEERQFSVSLSPPPVYRPLHAAFQAKAFRILINRELQRVGGDQGSERATRHIELALPAGISYQTGDHIGIFAMNRDSLVEQVSQRLGYSPDTQVTLTPRSQRDTFLPTGRPLSLGKILREFCELHDIITRRQLAILASYCLSSDEQLMLQGWAEDTPVGHKFYTSEVLDKRRSLIDILAQCKSCHLPLDIFLEQVGPIRPRYYSISSSPLKDAQRLSITVGVVSGPSLSENGTFKGTCSTFLQSRDEGETVYAFIKSPGAPFHPPKDPKTPVILVGPGTGFAPFRGFLQERDALQKSGQSVGPALLFFGCRRPEHDFIYQTEMEDFHQRGVAELYVAFSHIPQPEFPFVQDRMWQNRDKVWQMLEAGAVIFVCGDGIFMAPDVRRCFGRIWSEKTGKSAAEAEEWLNRMDDEGRYLVDVFGQKTG